MRRFVILAALLVATGLLAACGGGSSGSPSTTPGTSSGDKTTFTPIPGNSELVVGKNRVAIAVVDSKNDKLLGDPGNSVQLQFKDAHGDLIGQPEDATFVEAIAGTTGFWVLNHTFETAGNENAVITMTRGDQTTSVDVTFVITQTGNAPMIGAAAPPADNPTLASEPNKKKLTTDPEPNDAFYQMTVTQALDAHKPFVVVFGTPAFCQTALCGPMLDNVKAVQPEFADRVNFIHIEPYVLDENGSLVTAADGGPQPTQPTTDWNLQTEPWLFVVGADGKVTDRFEGSASPDELRQAIQADLG